MEQVTGGAVHAQPLSSNTRLYRGGLSGLRRVHHPDIAVGLVPGEIQNIGADRELAAKPTAPTLEHREPDRGVVGDRPRPHALFFPRPGVLAVIEPTAIC